MVVLGTLVDAQLLDHLAAQGILGEHARDRRSDGQIGLLLHHDFVRGLLQATRITGVTTVELLVELVAGEDDLIRSLFIFIYNL